MSSLSPYMEISSNPINQSRAFSFTPSGNWDGNDGAWSTFVIRVGTPAQLFRVLPSTNALETWLPVSDQCSQGMAWCGNARGVMPFNGAFESPYAGSPNGLLTSTLDAGLTCTANKSPMCDNCGSINGNCTTGPCTGRYCCRNSPVDCSSQGCSGLSGICTGLYIGCPCTGIDFNAPPGTQSSTTAFHPRLASGFQSNESSTWEEKPGNKIFTESFLNATSDALYGVDTLGLGLQASAGLTLSQSVIAGVPTEPFYLGILGLKPSLTTSVNNSTKYVSTATLMTQLKDQDLIPSLAFGYTAGAIYQEQPVLGSLTFGGYDASRFIQNNASFPLSGDNLTSPLVGIQSITATRTLNNNVTLLSNGITALIDTTLPFVWLPFSACQAFEQAFGLVWDDSKEYYFVNDTIHQQLLRQNPSVTFVLGNATSENGSVNITLPYGAFDLQASSPIFPNGTNYFPLRRASSPGQYTLGRTFLQEAYLLVDYEKSNFSISQAQYSPNNNPSIVTIDHSTQKPSSNSTSPGQQASHHPSRAAIVGIVVAASVAILFLLILAFFLFRRFRRGSSDSRIILASPTLRTEIEKSGLDNDSKTNATVEHTLQAIVSPDYKGPDRTVKDVPELAATGLFTHSTPRPIVPPWAMTRQELVGSGASKELPQTPAASPPRSPMRTSPQRVRHIYELAAEVNWDAKHKS